MKNQITMSEFADYINKYFDSKNITNIIEIGSLDGKDACFLKEKYQNANVYAIEGLEFNYEKYLKNLNNINCFNIIINEYDGFVNYYKKEINGIHGIFDRGSIYKGEILKNKQCRKIKTFALENNITSLDVLKIDVEGATLEVLKSAEEMVDTIKIMHIETESFEFFKNQKLHQKVVEFLQDKFSIIDISEVEIEKNKYQHDSVWINKTYLK